MARVLAQRATEEKSHKVVRVVKKAGVKTASDTSREKPEAKEKLSSKKGKPEDDRKAKKTSPLARTPVYKESMTMEAESRKPALRTGATSALDANSHLLRQTKSTSAALSMLEKGIELIFKKEFKKARTELSSLVEAHPNEMDILARARSYIQICVREEANLKKAPVSADQLYALGVMEHNKTNYDAAIGYFMQSLEKHPNADYIYYSVAASQAMKGDLADSIKNLQKAVELNEESRIYAKNDADFTALQAKKEFAELLGIATPAATEA
jgi:tetratricopeptide (TPR) repeat protein